MLVSFSVSNFRSFDAEQTFSLVASNRLSGQHEGHTVEIQDSCSRVLRAGVIYGANGAGKSNLCKALRLLKTIATSPRKKDAPIRREPFRFRAAAGGPTTLDLQFLVRGQLYRYGVKFDDTQILEEWLLRTTNGSDKALYERLASPTGAVKVEVGKILQLSEKFEALAKIGGPGNQSFLATVWATLDAADIPGEINEVCFWFDGHLRLIDPQDSILSTRFATDPGLREFAGSFLNASSTGVERLGLASTSLTAAEFYALLSYQTLPNLSSIPENKSWERTLPGGEVVKVERKNGFQFSLLRLQAAHSTGSGEAAPLDLEDESDGTRRLLQLIPALHTLKPDNPVYVIDEIDRSLHPMLVRNFIEYFLNTGQAKHRQLIATTHESSLLDQDLLRRDEIWFAEKDNSGATSLYSLLDFKVRNDLEIRKHYLQGRFGAVPYLGGVGRLMEGGVRPE